MPDDPNNHELTGHNYDGIQEYDNPTPGWWSWLFVLSILFAPAYLVVTAGLPSLFDYDEAYKAAETKLLMAQFADLGELTPTESTLKRFVTDPAEQKWLSAGKSIFTANCVACHGSEGIGSSGPNLTDDYFLNIVQPTDILRVVNKGANNGAMPAWESKLQTNEIILVSAYVASLRGKNLASGRPPEGNVIPPFFAAE